MSQVLIVAGDDVAQPVRLRRGGVNEALTGATITARLVTEDRTVLIDWTAQASGAAGADWANGLVVVEFPAAATAALDRAAKHYLYIRVLKAGKTTTWRVRFVEIDNPGT